MCRLRGSKFLGKGSRQVKGQNVLGKSLCTQVAGNVTLHCCLILGCFLGGEVWVR